MGEYAIRKSDGVEVKRGVPMNQSDRLKAFESERTDLLHDFQMDLIEPATLDILSRRLSDKYIQLARDEEVEQ